MKQSKNVIAITLALFILVSLCACTNSKATGTKAESNTSKANVSEEVLSSESAQTGSTVTSSNQESSVTSSIQESSVTSSNQESSQTTSSNIADNTSSSSQYTPRPKNPEKLSADMEKKIKEDYVAWLKKIDKSFTKDVSDITIREYLGTYSNGEAVRIHVDGDYYTCDIQEENIAGYDIWFSGAPLYIHKNSEFFTLEKAYNEGLITKQDVRDIKWYLNGD